MTNTAEHESWGKCVGEATLCSPHGRIVGAEESEYVCTGGHHIGPGEYLRCNSLFHKQDGPMSPGIGFIPNG